MSKIVTPLFALCRIVYRTQNGARKVAPANTVIDDYRASDLKGWQRQNAVREATVGEAAEHAAKKNRFSSEEEYDEAAGEILEGDGAGDGDVTGEGAGDDSGGSKPPKTTRSRAKLT